MSIAPDVLRTVWETGDPSAPTYTIESVQTPGDAYRRPAFLLAREPGQLGAGVAIGTVGGQLRLVRSDRERLLGYAWSEADRRDFLRPLTGLGGVTVQHGSLGRAVVLPSLRTLDASEETFVISGATTTNTITFSRAFGNAITSWLFDNGSLAVDFVNRGGVGTRGIQAALSFADLSSGEFRRHDLRQGGNIYSEIGLEDAVGGIASSPVALSNNDGSTSITWEVYPVEFDPDGVLAVPGLDGCHCGGRISPSIYLGAVLRQALTINVGGVEGLHELDSVWTLPIDVETAYFPVEAYHVVCLDAASFTRLRAFNAVGAVDSALASSTAGTANYAANYRCYVMNRQDIRGDDLAATASLISSGSGGVAACGATDADFAVLVGRTLSTDNLASTARRTGNFPDGNGWRWVQNRAGSSGRDGRNLVGLGHGVCLGGHLHPYLSTMTVDASAAVTTTLVVGSWTAVKSIAASNL